MIRPFEVGIVLLIELVQVRKYPRGIRAMLASENKNKQILNQDIHESHELI